MQLRERRHASAASGPPRTASLPDSLQRRTQRVLLHERVHRLGAALVTPIDRPPTGCSPAARHCPMIPMIPMILMILMSTMSTNAPTPISILNCHQRSRRIASS